MAAPPWLADLFLFAGGVGHGAAFLSSGEGLGELFDERLDREPAN
jgi:hypothetical protein